MPLNGKFGVSFLFQISDWFLGEDHVIWATIQNIFPVFFIWLFFSSLQVKNAFAEQKLKEQQQQVEDEARRERERLEELRKREQERILEVRSC